MKIADVTFLFKDHVDNNQTVPSFKTIPIKFADYKDLIEKIKSYLETGMLISFMIHPNDNLPFLKYDDPDKEIEIGAYIPKEDIKSIIVQFKKTLTMSIIGISGRAQSGKDTVGKIIQYLIYTKNNRMAYSSYSLLEELNHDWQIKKFADKVKQIVCLLTGCNMKQLEDEEFKNKTLNEDWWYHDDRQHNLKIPYSFEENTSLWYGGVPKVKFTYRQMLQFIGTDLFRNQFHPNTWVNALFNHYDKYFLKGSITNGKTIHLGELHNLPNWIITDVRFPNEVKAIEDRDGIIIRVNRIQTFMENKAKAMKSGNYDIHPSETSLDNAKFDYVIDNNRTIKDLIEQVKNVLIKEKIL